MCEHDQTLPNKIPKWRYDEIESSVVALFNELGITVFPIEPFEIAKSIGCVCWPLSKAAESVKTDFYDCGLEACSYYDTVRKHFIICYDDNMPYQRIRFSIMHEIGHIVLKHYHESNLAACEANCFASYALAPSPIIDKYKCVSEFSISDCFDVSLDCASRCFKRYGNWVKFCGLHKPYEKELVGMIVDK